jgi:hypothetical protein
MIQHKSTAKSWKNRVYIYGTVAGALFGLITAYMFSRASEEDVARTGQPVKMQPGDLISLGLAGLALVRQVTEMGRAGEKIQRKN